MQPARFAKAHGAAQHRGAGQVQFARLQHDRFVERLVLEPISFADENAQQDGFSRNLHLVGPS